MRATDTLSELGSARSSGISKTRKLPIPSATYSFTGTFQLQPLNRANASVIQSFVDSSATMLWHALCVGSPHTQDDISGLGGNYAN